MCCNPLNLASIIRHGHVEADGEVVLISWFLEHHVEAVGLTSGAHHEAAVLKEVTGVGKLRPLDVAEGAGEVVLSRKARIGMGGFRLEKDRHRGQGKERDEHHQCSSHHFGPFVK